MFAVRLLICLMGISPGSINRDEVASDVDRFISLLRDSQSCFLGTLTTSYRCQCRTRHPPIVCWRLSFGPVDPVCSRSLVAHRRIFPALAKALLKLAQDKIRYSASGLATTNMEVLIGSTTSCSKARRIRGVT